MPNAIFVSNFFRYGKIIIFQENSDSFINLKIQLRSIMKKMFLVLLIIAIAMIGIASAACCHARLLVEMRDFMTSRQVPAVQLLRLTHAGWKHTNDGNRVRDGHSGPYDRRQFSGLSAMEPVLLPGILLQDNTSPSTQALSRLSRQETSM